ncbi:MAG: septum formation initiator family protein [Alphaproteobacteria bacterium]
MQLLAELKNRIRSIIAPFFCGVMFVYFGYHAVSGDRGLFRWLALRQDLAQTQRIATNVSKEKQDLEKKVAHLSPESLDLDMLDECARKILNLRGENELVIIEDNN